MVYEKYLEKKTQDYLLLILRCLTQSVNDKGQGIGVTAHKTPRFTAGWCTLPVKWAFLVRDAIDKYLIEDKIKEKVLLMEKRRIDLRKSVIPFKLRGQPQ